MKFKSEEPFLLGLTALILGGLGYFFFKGLITWQQLTGAVLLLGLPSIFGREESALTTPDKAPEVTQVPEVSVEKDPENKS